MWISHLELYNFNRHRLKIFDLPKGLVGVVGRNGSGKTSVLDATEFLITGSAPRGGNKDENIRTGTADRDPSRVAGVLHHAGLTLEVVRDLKQTKKSQLAIDGGRPIFGESNVAAELAKILGGRMPLAAVARYIFIHQGKLHAFIDDNETTRADLYSYLFRTRAAAKHYDLLGRRIASLPVGAPTAELDTLRRQVADDREQLAGLRARKAEFADLKDYARDEDPDVRLAERYRKYREAKKAVDELYSRDEEFRDARKAARVEEREAKKRLAEVQSGLQAVEDDAEEARGALARWEAWRERSQALRRARQRCQDLAREAEQDAGPSRPERYLEESDAEEARIASLRRSVAEDERLLKTFDGDVAECPTCGTPVSAFGDRVAAAGEQLAANRDRLARLERRWKASREYDRAAARWQERAKARAEAAGRAEDDLADLARGEADPPDVPAEALRETLALQRRCKQALQEVQQAVAAAEAAHRLALARQEDHDAAKEKAQSRRNGLRVAKADYLAAKERLEAVDSRLHARGELFGRIKGLKASLADKEAMLARMEAEAADAAVNIELAEHLASVRAAMHPKALPKLVAEGYLELMEGDIDDLLEKFNAGFRVKTRKRDLGFDAAFSDARETQPAYRISGGEKVLLALAFWPTLNALFASDFGMLALDEPTLFLDSQNVGCIQHAVGKLRELASAKGLQVLLVTHEERLSSLFDSVLAF
jgi:DNA repair protein SbcC/Rad50